MFFGKNSSRRTAREEFRRAADHWKALVALADLDNMQVRVKRRTKASSLSESTMRNGLGL